MEILKDLKVLNKAQNCFNILKFVTDLYFTYFKNLLTFQVTSIIILEVI